MKYIIKLIYNDGATLNLELSYEEHQDFFNCLNSRKIFWGTKKLQGFWTQLESIRYIQVFPKEENEPPRLADSSRDIRESDCEASRAQTHDGTDPVSTGESA